VAKVGDGSRTLAFEGEPHASGGASREGPASVIDQSDPDRIVPIHTEAREWFADRFERVVLAGEGVAIEFQMRVGWRDPSPRAYGLMISFPKVFVSLSCKREKDI